MNAPFAAEPPVRAQGDRRSSPSVASSWSRALAMTAPIAKTPRRILATVVQEQADARPDAPALLSDGESFTYGHLAGRAARYAAWARTVGLRQGDTVCLLLRNRPEYLAAWLGISYTGVVVALLNTNLTGRALAHCINVTAPKYILTGADLAGGLAGAIPDVAGRPEIRIVGAAFEGWLGLDVELAGSEPRPPTPEPRRGATVNDTALLIYTSGTTGLPKAARVSHARIMQWSYWFAALMDASPDDRMYLCLPMYHSVGGVLATGAVLAAGGSVAISERFSARQFWNDVVRWDCTLFQYIGELCRYLLTAPPNPNESAHRIRLCCGNGLRGDVWEPFQKRFAIPRVLEFYASTEGNVSLFNVEGKPGAIGRIPRFLSHRFPAAVVRFDHDREEPVRNEQGFCVRSAPDEPGEAIGKVMNDGANVGGRFEGYTDDAASERKILRNVFEPGDLWFRTGDLMRQDAQGFFYFVDRIGDTFRWKGENVSTLEVSEAMCGFCGVTEANDYGVTVPGAEGRAAMAAITAAPGLDLPALREHLRECLPAYARPLFLRLCSAMDVTATFKQTKAALVRDGFDPSSAGDPIYFDHPLERRFVRIDDSLFREIQAGRFRL
jgi:fatty-acyl-CoA synthase